MLLVRTLDDGLSVWLDPMRDVRSVALGVYVAAGSVDEDPSLLGSTHFLEHLLFRRTRTRSGAAIARITDRLGGDCDAYTTKECVAFHARTTAERLETALDLLLDLTAAPAFSAEDVAVERGVILEEMAEASDIPEDRLHEALVRALWPAHPLGAPILGTRETVRRLSRAALVERFRAIFRPERTALVVAGAFDPDRLHALLARSLAGLRRRRSDRRPLGPVPLSRRRGNAPRTVRCAFHLPRPELAQTHVMIGSGAYAFAHPMVPAAWLSSVILGGGVSSRLWREVREREGLAYHVGAGLALYRAGGLALIEAATAPKNLPRLVRRTGRVLAQLRATGVTRTELRRAKDQMRAEILLSLESTASRREAAARAWLYRGHPEEPEEILARVEAVSADAVHEVLALLFSGRTALGLGVTGPDLAGATLDDLTGELAA